MRAHDPSTVTVSAATAPHPLDPPPHGRDCGEGDSGHVHGTRSRGRFAFTARFARAALTLALLALPGVVRAQSPCENSNVCHDYSGSVAMVGWETRCPAPPLRAIVGVCIQGPTSIMAPTSWAYDCFGDTVTTPNLNIVAVPCGPGGGWLYQWAASPGWDGPYVFQVTYPGYRPAQYLPSATCLGTGTGADFRGLCSGGFGAVLYPIDNEPVEPRQCEPEDAPPSANAPNASPGRPVNLINGNVWFDHTDASLPGIGAGLSLTRSYNSRLAYAGISGSFGRGWTHRHESKLAFPAADVIKLRRGDGSPVWFGDADGDQTFRVMLPKGEKSWIVKSGGTYARYFRQGGFESYDSAGKIVSETDASGNVTTYTYDASGRLETVADASGRSLTFAYDSNGRVVSASGPAGIVASYAYNPVWGHLDTVSYPDGSGYTFTYDTSGQVLSVVDATGKVLETHTYDASGRGITSSLADGQEKLTFYYGGVRTLVLDARGNVRDYEYIMVGGYTPRITKVSGGCSSCGGGGAQRGSWTYDSEARVVTYKDALDKTTRFSYDAEGDLVSETDPLNRTTSYTHDSQGRVLTVSRPDGRLTTYTHGAAGPTTVTEKVTATQNRTTTLTYTPQGKVNTLADPRGKTTTLAYNVSGDLISVTDPLGHATTFGYDSLGRRTTVADTLGNTTTTAYDARGRVTRVTSPDTTYTEFAYDLAGRRTSVTDPLKRITTYTYDDYGRLKAVTDPLGGTTTYAYDAASNLTGLTDAKGRTTSFAYDIYSRVSHATYPGGAVESFTYDDAGRLTKKTDRKGIVTTYSYDAVGRLTGKSYSNGDPAVSYTYDAGGRLLSAANGTDTLTWTYDLAGQLLTEASSKNASAVAYAYDDAGNRVSVGLDGTLFVSYAYDDASRLTAINRGSSAFAFGYDNANRRTSMSYPNGVGTTYAYDSLSRLTSLSAMLGQTLVSSSAYTYDAAGNRLTKTMADYSENYEYDALYRLRRAARGTTNYWEYTYDAVGNRLTNQIDQSVTTATHNDLNQLVSEAGGGALRVRGHLDEPGTAAVNGQPARMLAGNSFDATITATTGTNTITVVATDVSGNSQTKSWQVNVTGAGNSYSYDASGNLIQKVEGADTWAYTWSAENQLTRVVKNGLEVARFAYDAQGRRVEKVAGGVTTTFAYDGEDILRETRGATTLKYVHGPGIDEPLATEDASGALSFTHADGLGSIVKTTNASGAVTSTLRYNAFGVLESGTPNPFGFTAREFDAETGLLYLRARYLDPRLGRFLSEDPIQFEGGINFYSYVQNDPANFVDPYGLDGLMDDVQRILCWKGAWPPALAPPQTAAWPTNFPQVTSPFGRMRPSGPHGGADIRNPLGNPVFAPVCGCIEKVFSTPRGGNQIILGIANGSSFGFAHTRSGMGVGQCVCGGDPIGLSDSSGTNQPHLHITYRACETCPREDPIPRLGP